MQQDEATRALERLVRHHRQRPSLDMRAIFANDPDRFGRFSARFGDLFLDWSKCALTDDTMALLFDLATAAGVETRRDAMFSGAIVNPTERRPALHVALRNRSNRPIYVGNQDVMPEVNAVLARMRKFSDDVRSGALKGATGLAFTDILNIGIGGSDLGPAMATAALAPYHSGPRTHFVSNIDSAHISDTLRTLEPARTLVIVASKTFTTIETMTNAHAARNWLTEALGEAAVGAHFVAVSTAIDKVKAFGVDADRVFGFWDWVGGRYSLWSAIGLPLMIAIGVDRFERFLAGGHALDEHFRTAPLRQNLPIVLGLTGVWHRDICAYPSRAIIPYDQRLHRLPAYLQQLDMESNGKRVTIDGKDVPIPTGPVVWGEPGTNGQHAFFQLLHQGTDVIPVEFLIAAHSHEDRLTHHQDLLLANCLAQSEALMIGRTLAEAKQALIDAGMKEDEADRLAPHKTFPGNRPSLTIFYPMLEPYILGMLIALFEHRVFIEACIWNINPFDQWGVELGKELATKLLPVVQGKNAAASAGPATAGLASQLLKLRNQAPASPAPDDHDSDG